jgi:hypothetical protein
MNATSHVNHTDEHEFGSSYDLDQGFSEADVRPFLSNCISLARRQRLRA